MREIEALLICNSNMFVPTVLTEVLTNTEKQYIIISDTDNIRQFFDFLALPNVIYKHYGFNPKKDGRFGFIRKKNELLNYVFQYEIDKVVFFHAEFGAMANWLISQLSKKIPVKYCKLYDSIPAPQASFSLCALKIRASEYIYWGQKMDVLVSTCPFPSLPQSFFRKVKSENIKMSVDVAFVNNCLKGKLESLGIRGEYVLLTGTVVHDRYCSAEVYTDFINSLIETIGKDKVISKCHPRYSDLYGLEQQLPQIPSFIPGNVLIDNYEYYIGFESTLLVEAAVAGKIAISLIDMIQPLESVHKFIHDFFDNRLKGKGKIFYPQTMDELKTLL